MSGTLTPMQTLHQRYQMLTQATWPFGLPTIGLRWIRTSEPLLLRSGLIQSTFIDPTGDEEEEVPKAAAAPTEGNHAQGDKFDNIAPTVQGEAGARFIVEGWTCVQGGTPGTWVPRLVFTGN